MELLVFAGTSEGRALAEFLSRGGLRATVCVATEYGELALPPLAGIEVRRGRLDEAQMRARMTADTLVIDATHPYADAVTRNIRAACAAAGSEYLRLLRPRIAAAQPIVTVPSAAAAADYLSTVTGAALLTTGSKELAAFTATARFAERLYPRVLPTAAVVARCAELGFPGAHIIAMQGPFSRELNAALLRQIRAKFLVTKDTGAAGGFSEKLAAAQDAGATVVLIARPTEETGYTLEEIKAVLAKRFTLAETERVPAKFPLFIALDGKKALIVGAGHIAARRAAVLRRFGARVTVIAPEARGALEIDEVRAYAPGDIDGAALACAATDDRAVNHAVAEDCRRAGILCSVADCAQESTFFFPAVCAAGKLVAGVVSDGRDHAGAAKAAARIRAILEEEAGRADA